MTRRTPGPTPLGSRAESSCGPPRQVGRDGPGSDAEDLGRGLGIEVEEDPERDHFPLPLRQPAQRGVQAG
ncbi:MAG TPA: hypothetical protein VH912_22155, partial [Streptosporangiaceae bacterium]